MPRRRTRPLRSADLQDVNIQKRDTNQSNAYNDNSQGFPALPTELLLEIFSYIPPLPAPALTDDLKTSYCNRTRLLRGLSQMCTHLRSVFLPMAWESIEVFNTELERFETLTNVKRAALASDLIRQLEIVTVRDPTLSVCVKTVNVMLTNYSCKNVVEEFARCLALFPNLKTIQIFTVDNIFAPNPKYIDEAFARYRYQSVRTVVYPQYARSLLHACPGVRYVYDTGMGHTYQVGTLATTVKYCPNIYSFRGVLELCTLKWEIYNITDDKPRGRPPSAHLVIEVDSLGHRTNLWGNTGQPKDEERIYQGIYETILTFKNMASLPANLASINYIVNVKEGGRWFSVGSRALVKSAAAVLRRSTNTLGGSTRRKYVYLTYTDVVRSYCVGVAA